MQAPLESEVLRLRLELRARPDCRFVEAASYRKLLVSNRPLAREDHGAACLRGLRDTRTQTLFLIEEERLFSSFARTA